MPFLLMAALLLANAADFLEGRRLRAPFVLVGKVAEVRSVGVLEGVTSSRAERMEATLQVLKIVRSANPQASPPATVVIRYDRADPEPEGGIYYKLAPGEVVVVFARSLGKEYPIQILNGRPRGVREQVKAIRDALVKMDESALRLHGVTEAQRPDQQALYDNVLTALPSGQE